MSDTRAVESKRAVRTFKRYPAYKDSGVEWLGEIPAHWQVLSLKRVTSIKYGLGEPPQLLVDGLPFVRATNVSKGRITEHDLQFVDPNDVPWSRDPVLRTGDIVVVRSGAYTGDSAIIPENYDGAIAGYDMVVRVTRGQPRFLAWALLSRYVLEAQIELESTRAAQPHLNAEELGGVAILIPPDSEQRTIAVFLDRETARIDALVARKEWLIALLQEQRTALITRAVTKGLDPTVPMKDSGVAWLGEIPAHWEVTRLKEIVPAITVGIVVNPSKYYVDDGIPCLRSLNIAQGRVSIADLVFISSAANELHQKSKIFTGDVLVVRTGRAGAAVVVPPELDGSNCIDLLIIRRSAVTDSRFLYHFINSPSTQGQVEAHSVGAIQEHYNAGTLAELRMPGIPLSEQREIAASLDRETARIDALVAKIRDAIERLKELRTALISAAVTGKIDVGEEVA